MFAHVRGILIRAAQLNVSELKSQWEKLGLGKHWSQFIQIILANVLNQEQDSEE